MKIIFASQNENKAREIQNKLPQGIELITLKQLNDNENIEETGTTLEENAQIKALHIAQKYNLPCFADDSGLEIDALEGKPGVYSARYAGEDKNDDNNMNLVLKQLQNSTNRNAQFRTVIALHLHGQTSLFEGVVRGQISNQKTGTNGFGYDPIFIPHGHTKSFAEMTMDEKNAMSHRALAVEKLVEFLKSI